MLKSKNLQLLIIRKDNTNKNLVKFYKDLELYFFIEVKIDTFDKIEIYENKENKEFDYLIIENLSSKNMYNEKEYQKINNIFKHSTIFWMIKEYDSKNIFFLKYINNEILYFNDDYETLKVTNLSNLQNKWLDYDIGNFISHRSLFLDFVSNKFFLNNKELELTKKEFLVLTFLLTNRNSESISKNRIFHFVWDIDNDSDSSRVVDQILHKLKKKISISYFENVLDKGIKII